MVQQSRLLVYLHWSSSIAGICTLLIDYDPFRKHDEYCNITPNGLSTACCGSCILDPNCKLHGSCCLNKYRTFKAAATATDSSRYACVKSQFLSGPGTKYNYHTDFYRSVKYWMISKCHPGYTDMSIIQRCTNPGQDGSLDSILPVTLVTTEEVFRNKFCVMCNNIELCYYNIIFWTLDIYADSFIKFPHNNLLDRIKVNRGNIFFTPPKFVKSYKPCYMPEYTISKCNETGLWNIYDKVIVLACNSFIDPYNYTYKNVFCFLCNQRNIGPFNVLETDCEEEKYEDGKPGFTASVSRDAVLGYASKEQLSCGTRQHYHPTLKVCHDIVCFNGTLYDDGACNTKDVCYEMYRRATPVEPMPPVNVTKDGRYLEDLSRTFANFQIDEHVMIKNLFYHVDEFENIDYFILRLIADSNWDYLRDMIEKGLIVRNKTVFVTRRFVLPISDKDIGDIDNYTANIEPFIVTLNSKGDKLFVPSLNKENTIDVLDAVDQNLTYGSCELHVVTFNKIRVCPHLEIPFETYHFAVTKGCLVLETLANQWHGFKLFHWEYMIKGDRLLMCVTDFYRLNGYLQIPASNVAPHLTGEVFRCYMMISLVLFSSLIQKLMLH